MSPRCRLPVACLVKDLYSAIETGWQCLSHAESAQASEMLLGSHRSHSRMRIDLFWNAGQGCIMFTACDVAALTQALNADLSSFSCFERCNEVYVGLGKCVFLIDDAFPFICAASCIAGACGLSYPPLQA